ncbi:MAG: hypothetical protein MRZ63_08635 [Anaerostipes sp.]|nr:hypothetical protein [Anaerostipes sp.]
MEKRNAVRLVPCQARLAERIRVWLGVNPDSFGCSYVLASWAQEEKFSSSFNPQNPHLFDQSHYSYVISISQCTTPV